jgi:chromosome partitioning protein
VTFSDEPRLDFPAAAPPTDADPWAVPFDGNGDGLAEGESAPHAPDAPGQARPWEVAGEDTYEQGERPRVMPAAPEPVAAPAAGPAPSLPETNGETPERRPLPRVIALANQKGGVGKTTSTINIGACLAELGQRTLIIDLDPQGNASTGLGIENRGLETSMYHVLMHDVPLENCIEPTDVKHLFVAPASLDLAGAEIELVPAFSRETRLRRAIEAVIDDYDYLLIDCPPSLGLLTVNGLSAAHEVLVPIQCEYYALEGLGQLLRNVDLVRRNLNPTLHVSTIVCVMYDGRTKLADQVVSEVREHFGDKVLRTIVPRSVRLSEAPSFGQPIITFDPRSRGAIAYRDVAKEVHHVSAQRVG